MNRFIDLTGLRFGKLLVIRRTNIKKWGSTCWLCKCSCGKETVVDSHSLRKGNTKSCGCLNKEIHTKHGHTKDGKISKTYKAWISMNQRCNNTNDINYKHYGGRGITVCWKWSNKNPKGFDNFYKDVGDSPKGKSIDRINNNGNYEPNNWRWATNGQQHRNMRNTHLITFKGKTQCLLDWAKEYNMSSQTLTRRLNKMNWSVEKALTTPIRGRN